MNFAFRPYILAGLTAATLCVALMTSNEAAAQLFRQRATLYDHYNPYGRGFGNEFYGGRGYGYSGYGLGTYGVGTPGVQIYPSSGAFRHGSFYRGGSPRQFQTYDPRFNRNMPRYYSPFGYRTGW